MNKEICKECGHRIFWDERDNVWRHKHPLHNDNCDCRNPKRK